MQLVEYTCTSQLAVKQTSPQQIYQLYMVNGDEYENVPVGRNDKKKK